ncbi:hypothetical protein OH76DRAFT_1404645 [Lentinus brumalis]|uniref:DRBM domain-containing protein n=1 Tax=Lentinus brumalis TaxID=2498619 RepID=A0A371D850_9APHY|nr:hypothetical protein OH76DRAFT_1404645 [Polyporus brumalis]
MSNTDSYTTQLNNYLQEPIRNAPYILSWLPYDSKVTHSATRWKAICKINGVEQAEGEGPTKTDAMNAAAKAYLVKVGKIVVAASET